MINVQLQSGGDDCALFAIAFAEALCAGRDPFIMSFDQLQMRQHLKLCLERGVVTKFPESTKQKRGCCSRMRMSRKVYVYCTCRLPWNKQGKMAHCKEWFHQDCLNIPDAVFMDSLSVWACSDCEKF